MDAAAIPDNCIPAISCQYFLALHKDSQDDQKLWPIGIGTHIRQVLGALEAFAYATKIAALLWPFQFGIALASGMQFFVHAFHVLPDKYFLSATRGSTCSRAFIQFDLVNMFNAASRLSCKHELNNDLPDLVPVFDLLYYHSNICWYQKLDGLWDFFVQNEGFTQGCPLSPFLACKVLHPILHALYTKLMHGAAALLASGDLGDDGKGSEMVMGSYLDDTGAMIPYIDIEFAICTFQELGAPHGLILNLDKTKILTTLDPEVLAVDPDLLPALELLTPTNCLSHGTVYLGSPFGCNAFITEQLDSAADVFDASHLAIQSQLSDHQTQMTLFTKCLQATVPHLLVADVLQHSSSALHPLDPYDWSSHFVSQLKDLTAAFLAFIAGQPVSSFRGSSPQWFLAHTPVVSGGRPCPP